MTSPAPREPLAPSEPVRAVFELLDADPKLEGKGLSEAFARSFPEPPVEAEALAATEAARMAVILGVPGIATMDVVQSVAPAQQKVKMLVGLVGARLAEFSEGHSISFETPGSVIPPSTGSPVQQATLDASFDARPQASPLI